MKNKQELFVEAERLAKIHQQKKEIIEKIFSDLDKEEKTSHKHLSGIAAVNEILKEIKTLEDEHSEVLEKIKGA